MASIKRQLDEMGAKDTEQRFGELAKRAGGLIRSKALPILLRGLARKALDDETAKEVLDVIGASEEDISSFVGAMAEEQLRAQEAAEEALARFREYLGETVTALTEKEQDPARRKIIIFVDELDRCRPTYAIEVLECVKHLFSVEGLVFVLALDDEQLRNTIASVYGAGFDGWTSLNVTSKVLRPATSTAIGRTSVRYFIPGFSRKRTTESYVWIGVTSKPKSIR